jgi:hypothetical protein
MQVTPPVHASTLAGAKKVNRLLYVDSNLAPVTEGGLVAKIPDNFTNVTRITLREALIPRTDDLLYVLLGIRCNQDQRPSLLQLGADPNSATAQNSNTVSMNPNYYSLTKVTPHLPIFAELPVGNADSVTQLNASALNVKYAFIDHHQDTIFSYELLPALRTLDSLEVQLYKAPSGPSEYNTLPPYDISVYSIEFEGPITQQAGTVITNKLASDQLPRSIDFTATILAVDANKPNIALVGNITPLNGFTTYITHIGEEGVNDSERTLFDTSGASNIIGKITGPSAIASLATRLLLLFEIECYA